MSVKTKAMLSRTSLRSGLQDFHEMPGYLVRRTHQISTAIFTEECARHDLTAIQYASLVAIGLHPLIDATRISRLISLDRSTLGDVLERIETKGLVHRVASPTDKRIKLLILSEKGEQLLADVEASVQRVQERLLQPLTAADRKTLLRLLTQLAEGHKDLPPA